MKEAQIQGACKLSYFQHIVSRCRHLKESWLISTARCWAAGAYSPALAHSCAP